MEVRGLVTCGAVYMRGIMSTLRVIKGLGAIKSPMGWYPWGMGEGWRLAGQGIAGNDGKDDGPAMLAAELWGIGAVGAVTHPMVHPVKNLCV